MTDSKLGNLASATRLTREWLIPGTIILYQLLAVVAFVFISITAVAWIRIPFLGAFVENTLYVSALHYPTVSESWPLIDVAGGGYQIVAIDGREITHVSELPHILAGYSIDDSVTVTIRTERVEHEKAIPLISFPRADQVTYFLIPFMIGLFIWGSGVWVFFLRGKDTVGRVFAIFATSLALVISGLFDLFTTNRLTYIWTISLGITAGALYHLAVSYPRDHSLLNRYPFMRWIGYLAALVGILVALPSMYNLDTPLVYTLGWGIELAVGGCSVLLFMFLMRSHYRNTSFPVIKEQARLSMIGLAGSIAPVLIWFLARLIVPRLHYSSYILLPAILFPLSIAYTVSRYRLLTTNILFSRALVYILLTILAAAGYALLTTGLTLIIGNSFIVRNPYVIAIIILVFALSLVPLRNTIQRSIDSVFLRNQAIYRNRLQAFGRELTRAVDLAAIVARLRAFVVEDLKPTHLYIFTYDPLTDQYLEAPAISGSGEAHASDLRFHPNSALVTTLMAQRSSIFLGEARTLPESLKPEQARIALLNSQVFVPLPGSQLLTGWLALGIRQSGEAYNSYDLEYLESLCDQAALAIERAQVVVDLERRVHEMNVLTRVAQGINITLAFDDILELIYAQTNQIIPTRDFRITLYDRLNDFLYPAFFLENDERLVELENYPLPIGHGLEREVLRERRTVVCDDYDRECKARGLLPSTTGIFAWVGVPLNTGAETIGILSLASRDPSSLFTIEQINILQAIADQAAGAIVKARLLEESERRTRHLKMLNEVARNLTSTLAMEPLLDQILNSAVEILNCESGSLLLVEEDTGYLTLMAAFGPETPGLLGLRLPKGSGLVGKAVDTRLPIIHNDIRRSKDWLKKPNEKSGVTVNDILVVPMQVKGQVLGVIEVINRKDSLPFTADDQELLIAFTSQAAVALENARLYTLTDQNLADRVEELSVMQRIDRELNTSLDISRAMRITLEWAMQQSKADAGLVGIVETDRIRVMTAQGYENELHDYVDAILPITLPSILEAINSGQPQWVSLRDQDSTQPAYLLTNCKSQAVIPIRREQEVIGILLLESLESGFILPETQAFLSRLSDHAAISISNAQLFAAVQAANVAKSDFVSFVSHELKTPMTSIKGFTDLLSAGIVGPINDAQSHFLDTIRSNVDRMTTLVSDLADVSRIETGRLRLDFAPVRIGDILAEVIRSAKSQMDQKNQTLNLNVNQDLPPMWGDQTRMIQIVTNLVNNAHKYTPSGGEITISAEIAANQWNPNGAANVIHVKVKDTGIGISPDNQKKIFQKFFRADDTKVRDTPGTGLGLNITKTLVEMQGGQIWFESVVDQGTTFHFTIPVVEVS